MEKIETSNQVFGNPAVIPLHVPEPVCSVELSERDAAAVLSTAENPPPPNEAGDAGGRAFFAASWTKLQLSFFRQSKRRRLSTVASSR